MGLSIEVGMLATLMEEDPEFAEDFRKSLGHASDALVAAGLPTHVEPESLPPLQSRCALAGYPYSFLHNLRRVYAHVAADPHWRMTPQRNDDPTDRAVLQEETRRMKSHLLCHSDCDGFYFPVDFEVPFRGPGLIGSSYRLKAELISIAPTLDIPLNLGGLSDSDAAAINAAFEAGKEFGTERIVWLSLYEAARLSIEHKTAICFM